VAAERAIRAGVGTRANPRMSTGAIEIVGEDHRSNHMLRNKAGIFSKMKSALITGISGQDGSYLAEYLLELGYQVWGLVRRQSCVHALAASPSFPHRDRIRNLRDTESLAVAFQKAWPDEVYNLAGQVFVPTVGKSPRRPFVHQRRGKWVTSCMQMREKRTKAGYGGFTKASTF